MAYSLNELIARQRQPYFDDTITHVVETSKEPVCPRVELILKIIIIY